MPVLTPLSRRDRYTATAALTYLLFAVAWILVSDPLLALLVDPQAMLRLSLAKGLLFVLATAVLFYVAMRGVPAADAGPGQRPPDTDTTDPSRLPAWVGHLMAVALTGLALGLRLALPVPALEQPLLVVFVLPVVLSALLGGVGPGLTATLLSTLAAAWLLWPAGRPQPAMPAADQVRLLVLLGSGLTICAISAALRQSRARLAAQRNVLVSVVEGTDDAIFVKDLQGRYTLANRATTEILGRPLDQVLGRDDRALFPQGSAEVIDERDRAVLTEGVSRTHEERLTLPGGDRRVFLVSKGPVRDAAGRVIGLFGIARDITEREQSAATLRENTAALNAAQHLAGIGSWSWNLRTDEHRWSDEVYRLYGLDPTQPPAVYPEVQHHFSPETWAELVAAIDHTRASGEPYACDVELLRGDGTRRWITARGEAVRGADGAVIELRGTVQDTTERRLAEQKVRDSESRLQLVLDTTRDGIWDWDVRTGHVYRSPRYFEVTGQRPEDDTQDFGFFDRLLHPQDRERVLATIADHRAGRTPLIRFDTRIVTPAGGWRWLRVQGRAVERAADGAPLRLVGMLSDVTDEQAAQAALREREQQLERVIEGADVGYWDWDLHTQAFVVSPRYESMLGHTPGTMDLRVESWPELIHPDDWPQMQRVIADHLAGHSPAIEHELRVRARDGAWRWILTRGRIVERAADGAPARVAGTHTDIGERKAQELALREAATVFGSTYEGIMVVGPDMRVLKVNPAFTRITGYAADEVIGRSPQVLASGRHDRGFYAEMRRTLQLHGNWRGEIWNRRRDGSVYPELLSITEVRDAQGVLEHYVGVFSDISQVKAHEAELDRIAHYDPLTGLPNRRLLSDRIRHAVAHAQRGGRQVAVCFLDLDGFKAVNDDHGHAVGDRLLLGVTQQLGRLLRADDTLSRLGGDEFVLLLSDLHSVEECRQVLDRVLVGIAHPVEIALADGRGSLRLALTASIGVSLYPQDDGDPDTLLRHADQAMYRAKEAGKNRYQLFDPETDRQAQAHRQHLARLQRALDQGEFELHYQPKVDLASGELLGAEGLIRWRRPEADRPDAAAVLVPPGEFLPVIEGSPLEHAVGDWVIASGLAQAEAWHDQGLTLTVSVNVGANQLLQHDFADRLAVALARHPRLPRAAFELEVLESAAIADIAQAVTVMERCRALGVRFALDDFGTGYSSLTYLRRLPIDTLKIDQSFVRRMLDDAEDCGIVEGVIRLAAAFGREVIAEGVETAAHGERLLALGCRCGQGYGIARPMPAAQLPAWAADRGAR